MVIRVRPKELVMEAIRRLRIERGFTAKEITQYIESNHDVKALDLRRGVNAALKRGADYGLFKAQRGGRYALRLSPTVPRLVAKRKDESEEDGVNERGCAKKRRKSRRRCCTKMWMPKRRRRSGSRKKSSCKRRRKRTRKNRSAKRRRRSRKNRCAKRRRRSGKNRCKRRSRSRRHSRRRRAKRRC